MVGWIHSREGIPDGKEPCGVFCCPISPATAIQPTSWCSGAGLNFPITMTARMPTLRQKPAWKGKIRPVIGSKRYRCVSQGYLPKIESWCARREFTGVRQVIEGSKGSKGGVEGKPDATPKHRPFDLVPSQSPQSRRRSSQKRRSAAPFNPRQDAFAQEPDSVKPNQGLLGGSQASQQAEDSSPCFPPPAWLRLRSGVPPLDMAEIGQEATA